MLFANMCARFINSCYGEVWDGLLFGALCIWRVLVLLVSLLCTRLGCLLLDTPFGRRSVEALPL